MVVHRVGVAAAAVLNTAVRPLSGYSEGFSFYGQRSTGPGTFLHERLNRWPLSHATAGY